MPTDPTALLDAIEAECRAETDPTATMEHRQALLTSRITAEMDWQEAGYPRAPRGPVFLAVYIGTTNNGNGNPRRGWYVSRLDGQPVIASAPTGRKGETAPAYTCWVEEEYAGHFALECAVCGPALPSELKGHGIDTRKYADRARALVHETGRIEVTPGEYRDARKLPRFGGAS